MKYIIIILMVLLVGVGLYCGYKANWQFCDDPQVCDAI